MEDTTIPEEGDDLEVEYTTEDGERESLVLNDVDSVLEEDDLSPSDEFVGLDYEEHQTLLLIDSFDIEETDFGSDKEIVYEILVAEEASLLMRGEDDIDPADWDILGGDVEWEVV